MAQPPLFSSIYIYIHNEDCIFDLTVMVSGTIDIFPEITDFLPDLIDIFPEIITVGLAPFVFRERWAHLGPQKVWGNFGTSGFRKCSP